MIEVSVKVKDQGEDYTTFIFKGTPNQLIELVAKSGGVLCRPNGFEFKYIPSSEIKEIRMRDMNTGEEYDGAVYW